MKSKKVFYNIVSNFSLQIIVIIYGFIVPKIIISQFGSNINGLVSSIAQFLGYIVLLEAGFGPVVKSVLYKPIASKKKNEIESILKASNKFFKRIAVVFVFYIIALAFLYPFIVNREFDYWYSASLIFIISISTLSEYFFGMTYKLYLQAEQRNYVLSLIQILTYLLSIVLIIVLAKVNASIHVIKLVTAFVFVLRPIIQNIYIKKHYDINLKNGVDDYKIEKKWDGLAQHIAAVIHSNTDVTVLTFFCNMAEVSVYAVYLMIIKGIKLFIESLSNGIDAFFGEKIAKGEKQQLSESFDFYEVIYDTLCTIIYTCTLILIVPFVSIYTRNITDVDYIRYTFGFLIVVSEYIWAVRLPFSSLIQSAGHFKETRVGAWVEAIVNIVVSIILVSKYGLIGVAIGTCVAMTIRTIEFIYHANKYILKRNIFDSVKKVILIIVETVIVLLTYEYIIKINNLNYFTWILSALEVAIYSSLVVIIINMIFYKSKYLEAIRLLKRIIKKEKN